MPEGKKKTIKRRPGSTSKNYFDMDTQAAIVAYAKAATKEEKEQIYNTKILIALKTLVENLINVYNFHVMFETKEDLRDECVSFLSQAFTKFDPEKGRAFAYFNIVAKHWLTIKSKASTKNSIALVSFENKASLSQRDLQVLEERTTVPSFDEQEKLEDDKRIMDRVLDDIKLHLSTNQERIVFSAIEKLFKHSEDLDVINKRATSLYLRNITGYHGKQLTVPLANIRKLYAESKKYIMDDEYGADTDV